RLALIADQEGRRILIAAADVGDVGELEIAPARHDRRVGNLLQIVIGAVEPYENLRPLGIDRARRRDGVLALERREDVLRADAERDEPRIRELDEDPLRALAEYVDLLHAGDVQQLLPDRLGLPHEEARRHPRRFQGVEREGDVGILVVDEGAEHAGRQVPGLVAQPLARLLELFRDVGRRRAVPDGYRHEVEARPRHRLDAVIPAQLLHPFLERLGNEILHLLRGGTRPGRGDSQHLDGERRVLGATELEESIGARSSDGDDEEQGDGALAHRQGGEVEAGPRAATLSSAMWTRSPSCRRWAPSATMRSPALMPLTMAVSSASRRTCTALRDTDDDWGSTTHTPPDWPSS